jgi:hypothetical protein
MGKGKIRHKETKVEDLPLGRGNGQREKGKGKIRNKETKKKVPWRRESFSKIWR